MSMGLEKVRKLSTGFAVGSEVLMLMLPLLSGFNMTSERPQTPFIEAS